MKTEYFKLMGQKSLYGKMIVFAVVPDDLFGQVPDIFECEAFLMPATIYTGTYPQIKVNTDTVKDVTDEHKGMGIAGIITETWWANKTIEQEDQLGISIKK
jgi:hypothetical protein